MSYNGWTNYETWAVKLWMDNEEGSYNYWREQAIECWEASDDHMPNRFMDRSDNARTLLADRLESAYDDASDHPVFEAAAGTVYADLLNAALGDVEWREIADSLLSDMADNATEDTDHGHYAASR